LKKLSFLLLLRRRPQKLEEPHTVAFFSPVSAPDADGSRISLTVAALVAR
jgi:hypothetical protein